MMRFPSKLTLDPDTSAALSSLVDGLTPLDPLLAGLDTIDAADIPPPCHDLLVHSNHMTSTLQNYYSGAMELHVVKDHAAKEDYRRMILLTVEGTTKVVEFGIVRIDLTLTSAEVRAAILAIANAIAIAVAVRAVRHTITVSISTMTISIPASIRIVVSDAARQQTAEGDQQHGKLFHISSGTK